MVFILKEDRTRNIEEEHCNAYFLLDFVTLPFEISFRLSEFAFTPKHSTLSEFFNHEIFAVFGSRAIGILGTVDSGNG